MKSILIVDDERIIREGIANCLDRQAIGINDVLMAADGKTAYHLLKEQPVDIVLTDIVMPELNGLELIEMCRKEKISSEFIILSSYADFHYAQQAIKCNVCAYILKPCKAEELNDTIKRLVEKIDEAKGLEAEQLPRESYGKIMRIALNYIDEHLCDSSLTLNQIASSVLFVNTDYLGKLFRKECGVKFSSYLLSLRMEKAKQTLLAADITIGQVAELCGFGDNYAYFSQSFKKYTGVSPKEYKYGMPAIY